MSYQMTGLGGYATRGECREATFDKCLADCTAGLLPDTTGFHCKQGAWQGSFCITNCTERCLGEACDQYPVVGTMQKGIVPSTIPGVSPSSELSAEAFPWKAYSSATEQLQYSLNQKLAHDGLCTISTDGKLGPGTCGAAQHYGASPPTCQSFTAPKQCAGGGGSNSGGGGGGGALPAPSESNLMPWLLGGAVVLGVGYLFWKGR
jgi:hypothetical protein